MRIEGGILRGRVIAAPPGPATRPTDGRTREMLFNSLGEFVIGARVLDLYAGSGSVGLEALSRGADFCIFVENDFPAVRPLKANLKSLRLGEKAQVWAANARSSVDKLVLAGEKFDLVFADPPFTHPKEAGEIAKRIDACAALLNNQLGDLRALVVIQHSFRVELPQLEHLELVREKRAGESRLSFFASKALIPSADKPDDILNASN